MNNDVSESKDIYIDKIKLEEAIAKILDLESKNLKTKELNNKEMAMKIKEHIKHAINKGK